MKNKLALVLVAATAMLFTTCKKAAQVDLVGSWKMSSMCTGDDDRATVDLEIFPGSGEDEILISNIIEQMTVYFTVTGDISGDEYPTHPTAKTVTATIDKKDISVNFVYTDPFYDAVTDDIEDDRSYTVSGDGTISDKNERITLDLTITFPNYDPSVQSDGSEAAKPKPLKNTCQYSLVKDRDDD